ncbi:MAG: septation protein A, partial [Proteobacteria bacterium]|nr:septation protein A [Pseudomonadota bacterium]
FSENFWVNFKLFGSLTWTLLFVIIQSIWISYKGEFIGSESSN